MLSEKKFDPSKPCMTRDGRPARILCTDRNCAEGYCTIVALISEPTGEEWAFYYKESGMNGIAPSVFDLVNIPVKESKWAVVFHVYLPHADCYLKLFNTKDYANLYKSNLSSNSVIGLMRLDYEDDILVNKVFEE